MTAIATTSTTITHTAAECWEDCEGMVRGLVGAFQRKHGGEYDDLLGQAQIAFMLGHTAYLNGCTRGAPYELQIRRWVWYTLFDAYRTRTQYRRKEKTVINAVEFPELLVDRTFNTTEFFDDLTPDATAVAGLVLDGPCDLAAEYEAKGGQPRNIRSTLRTYLKQRGWDTARINAAFDEVADALNTR